MNLQDKTFLQSKIKPKLELNDTFHAHWTSCHLSKTYGWRVFVKAVVDKIKKDDYFLDIGDVKPPLIYFSISVTTKD